MSLLQINFSTKKIVQTVQNPNMQKVKIEKPQMQKMYPNMQKFIRTNLKGFNWEKVSL